MLLNRTSDWKVRTILNFSRASFIQFQAYRYIIGLNRTSKSKVMVVWIFLALPCLIWSITIYFALEFDIGVKFYDYLNFLSASVVQFWSSWYIIGLNRTSESNVMLVWTCLGLPFLISRYILLVNRKDEWKVRSIWISREPPLFNFKRIDILLAWIRHPSQKLWLFEFALRFHV